MYLGTICTNDIVQYQYNYQSSEELSENSVVIMYDPIVSTKGVLVLKAFRLSKTFLEMKRSKSNQFIRPSEILEELPLKIRNVGHVSAFLRCIQDTPEVFQQYMTLKKISQLIVIPTFSSIFLSTKLNWVASTTPCPPPVATPIRRSTWSCWEISWTTWSANNNAFNNIPRLFPRRDRSICVG